MPFPRSETSELAYTTRKIEANFSNFSAWHQRSKVYTKLWASGQLDPKKNREEGGLPDFVSSWLLLTERFSELQSLNW